MYVIGLTGGIATGKSTVLKMLAELGADIIDADKIAHEVIEPGGSAYDAVIEAFGSDIVRDDGTIDRGKLGDIVFNDPDALALLESLTHPAVAEVIQRRVDEADSTVVAIEAIKLIETGMHRRTDALWIVTAPREVQIRRLVEQRQMRRQAAEARIDAQPPIESRLPLADVVIRNDGSMDELWQQVIASWQMIPEEERRASRSA